ncbi:MAG: hypothetical protein C4570_07790 [Ammonifex sp.]|nr:MAG: hypothetical protein C4570_07790 [Ammonifex sp.]
MPRGLLVKWTVRSGEFEDIGRALLRFPYKRKPEDVIDKYFSDFYGEGTVCEEYARCYARPNGEQALEVDDYQVVPPRDYEVLKRYGLEE